jgi:hypothetical protein
MSWEQLEYARHVRAWGGMCAHLGKVLVVVGVGVAAEFGAVNGEPEQAHIGRQVNLRGLISQHRNCAAGVRAAQRRNEAGVWLGQLILVVALQR